MQFIEIVWGSPQRYVGVMKLIILFLPLLGKTGHHIEGYIQ